MHALSLSPTSERWSTERANAWYAHQPWLCGFNFLPSTAVNFIDMWQAESFDAETIARELAWASDIGFNTLRTNLPYAVWANDPDGLLDRIDRLLAIASDLGLKTMLCIMDDCGFSGEEGYIGVQPPPVAGVHNSRAVASPGRRRVSDRTSWATIEAYVTGVVSRFRDDARVLLWDIYNEPGNHMVLRSDRPDFSRAVLEPASHDLMVAAFGWARATKPTQPLTVGAWHIPLPWEDQSGPVYEHAIDRKAIELSDVVSFHAYCPTSSMLHLIQRLESHGRPLLCTEWMARHAGSTISDQLPLLKDRKVAAWQWGLVNGRTQTHLPWPQITTPGSDREHQWFHDLLLEGGAAYDPAEIEVIGRLTGRTAS